MSRMGVYDLEYGFIPFDDPQPQEEDLVSVVRCKDCRFYRYYDGAFGKGWMCFENNTARHGDDYCSRGEWKDNA